MRDNIRFAILATDESGTARYFELELAPNSVNTSLLTEFQQAAADGALQQTMHSCIEYLKTLLSDEKAFVVPSQRCFPNSGAVTITDRSAPAEGNNLVGYQDENYIYLLKDAAHKAVRKLCDEQGENFSISSSALLTELENDCLLERTRSVKVGGTNKRLMLLFKNKVAAIVGAAL